jgi:hypothetical protein
VKMSVSVFWVVSRYRRFGGLKIEVALSFGTQVYLPISVHTPPTPTCKLIDLLLLVSKVYSAFQTINKLVK